MIILGIDDNEDINLLLGAVLESEGHEFKYVNNGRDGLKLMQENQYDMVFLDLAMPEFDGISVIAALVKDGIINKQKVIIFTASSMSDTELDKMIKLGVFDYIKKPVELDTLLAKISKVSAVEKTIKQ